jgi:hypothetical protein
MTSNSPPLGLLRARREWPRRRAAKQRDEGVRAVMCPALFTQSGWTAGADGVREPIGVPYQPLDPKEEKFGGW